MEKLLICHFFKRLLPALLSLSVLLSAAACDSERSLPLESAPDQPEAIEIPLSAVEALEAVDLRQAHPATFRRLDSDEAQLFGSCRDLFEEEGRFLDWPFDEDQTPAALFGCDPEAALHLDDGTRAIAYATKMPGFERATDLQVLIYNPDGTLQWHHKLDRSEEATNFAANFRGSFLTAVGDSLICTGTLWQGATQAACIRRDDGEVVFDGPLNFWAGLEPFGYDGSLFSTDIRGITRRYPFRGTEMRHRSLEGRGGRAAFYATDQERIFFVPAEDTPYLSAWELNDMRQIWRVELPDRPRVSYSPVSPRHRLLLLKIDEQVYGFDTETGSPRMALTVGAAHPSVAFSQDTLFMLIRRDDEPPLLYALDPTDGSIHWSALAPAGTLQIAFDQKLLTRSVRAVRTVRPLNGD